MDEFESLSHSKWGCKYHVCIYTEVPPQGVVRESSEAFGRGIPQAGRAEGVQDRRRASAVHQIGDVAKGNVAVENIVEGGVNVAVFEHDVEEPLGLVVARKGVWQRFGTKWAILLNTTVRCSRRISRNPLGITWNGQPASVYPVALVLTRVPNALSACRRTHRVRDLP